MIASLGWNRGKRRCVRFREAIFALGKTAAAIQESTAALTGVVQTRQSVLGPITAVQMTRRLVVAKLVAHPAPSAVRALQRVVARPITVVAVMAVVQKEKRVAAAVAAQLEMFANAMSVSTKA